MVSESISAVSKEEAGREGDGQRKDKGNSDDLLRDPVVLVNAVGLDQFLPM